MRSNCSSNHFSLVAYCFKPNKEKWNQKRTYQAPTRIDTLKMKCKVFLRFSFKFINEKRIN